MAWLFGDSFDHYADALKLQKWTSYTAGRLGTITIVASEGTRGTQALKLYAPTGGGGVGSTGFLSLVPNQPTVTGSTVIFGFKIRVASGLASLDPGTDPDDQDSACLCVVRGATVNLCWVRLRTNGTFSIYRGSTLLGTTSIGIAETVASTCECQILLDNTVGTVQCWLDNAQVLSLTGIDTTNGGTSWDEFRWGSLGITGAEGVTSFVGYIDDFTLLDGSGAVAANANRWGPATAYAVYPNAVGDASEWDRSTGANQWATIDEALMNEDVDYNYTSTLDNEDLLNFPDLDIDGAPIRGIQGNVEVRTEDGGAAEVKLLTRQSSTTYAGDTRTVPSTYAVRRQPWGVNPATGAAWTEAEYNAAQFGYRKTA
jgi:hypothetical protein